MGVDLGHQSRDVVHELHQLGVNSVPDVDVDRRMRMCMFLRISIVAIVANDATVGNDAIVASAVASTVVSAVGSAIYSIVSAVGSAIVEASIGPVVVASI